MLCYVYFILLINLNILSTLFTILLQILNKICFKKYFIFKIIYKQLIYKKNSSNEEFIMKE